MTMDEIVRAISAVRMDEVAETVADQLRRGGIHYAALGIPKFGARLDIAVDVESRTAATDAARSAGFELVFECAGQSHHQRGIVELHLHYVESATLERMLAGSTHDRGVLIADRMDWSVYFELSSQSSRGLPPDVTPASAEPFTL